MKFGEPRIMKSLGFKRPRVGPATCLAREHYRCRAGGRKHVLCRSRVVVRRHDPAYVTASTSRMRLWIGGSRAGKCKRAANLYLRLCCCEGDHHRILLTGEEQQYAPCSTTSMYKFAGAHRWHALLTIYDDLHSGRPQRCRNLFARATRPLSL